MAEQVDKMVIEFVGRHVQEAIEQGQYDYISKNTIMIRMFDAGNMPEGTHLRVEIKIGEEGEA